MQRILPEHHIFIQVIFRYCLFIAFFIHCLRTITVYLNYIPTKLFWAALFLVIIAFIFSLIKTRLSLYFFIAFIPLLSGIKVIGVLRSAPLLSFIFSIIFISWFIKSVFSEKDLFKPKNQIGNTIDVLSVIVFLSFFACLLRYPVDFVLYRIKYASTLGQSDPFWFIEASFIILQGLFLFRIVDSEIDNKKQWNGFIKCLYVQAIIIIIFSLIQLFFNFPQNPEKLKSAINSPFFDVHAYGGYVVFFFFFFLSLIKNKENRHYYFLTATILFVCILLSSSSATLLAMLIVGCGLAALSFKKRTLIIIISFVIFSIIGFNAIPKKILHSNDITKRYSDRLNIDGAISKLKGRYQSGDQALGILEKFPFTGSGIGTFYKISRFYHFSDTNRFSRHENAHNYYLQFAADMGMPALLILLLIIFIAYRNSVLYLKFNNKEKNIVLGLLAGLSAYLITMLTGHHLISSSHQFLFWFVIALLSCVSTFEENTFAGLQKKHIKLIFSIAFILIISGHFYNFGVNKKIKGYEYGFYEYENVAKNKLRWTGKEACTRVNVNSAILSFDIFADSSNINENGLQLDLFINNQKFDSFYFFNTGIKQFNYYIPSLLNKEIDVKIKVNKVFNPYKKGLSKDVKKNREQGVAMSPLRFFKIFPKDGLGFYNNEQINNENTLKKDFNEAAIIRLSRLRSAINIENDLLHGESIFLKCSHPDVQNNPLEINIYKDDLHIKNVILKNHEWKKIDMDMADLISGKALTFVLSRTWNPKSLGISNDTKDIGVEVLIK